MTTHSAERKLFNHYRKALFNELGVKALDNYAIDRVGKHEFAAWGGCHAVDRVKLKPHHLYIINTDTHDKPGEHWVAMATTGTRAYIYDSYGRDVRKIVYQLIKTINKSRYKLSKTNLVPQEEQVGFSSEVCGQNSLAFLLVARDLGITKARNI